MNPPLARWASLKPSGRLRVVGTVVLVCGVTGAALFYWFVARTAGPTLDELMPGYARARDRQIGIMMGNFGVTLMQWLDALKDPTTQAIMTAIVSTLVALGCFRVAWLLDQQQPDEEPAPHPRDNG